jgi:hypothetical protein
VVFLFGACGRFRYSTKFNKNLLSRVYKRLFL